MITKVNDNGFSVGEKFSSAQANQLDANLASALDKRAGQTDQLASIVSCVGSGRIVSSYTTGPDANTTFALSSGISIINGSAISANRNYTISPVGAVLGDTVMILGGALFDITVKDGASSSNIIVIGAASTGLNASRWAELLWNGSNWVLIASSFAPQQQRQAFTANGTYTVPPDCYKLLVFGVGGGGGGGGGCSGCYDPSGAVYASGGSGGGASMFGGTWVDTTPGTIFTITTATGGAGGAGGASSSVSSTPNNGSNGSDGGSSTFGSAVTFYGAQGGLGASWQDASHWVYLPGGGPVAGGVRAAAGTATTTSPSAGQDTKIGVRLPGEGGFSVNPRNADMVVGPPTVGYNAAGNFPTVSSTIAGSGTTTPGAAALPGSANGGSNGQGGGGGGGGGASTLGNGGNAGAGGANSNTGGIGSPGSAGSAGGTGAGGGGGGAGGGATNAAGSGTAGTGGAGGAGGAGGGGAIVVVPVR